MCTVAELDTLAELDMLAELDDLDDLDVLAFTCGLADLDMYSS
jgi:hypothetical protein